MKYYENLKRFFNQKNIHPNCRHIMIPVPLNIYDIILNKQSKERILKANYN